MSEDLPEKVRRWLETQGYPLEMKVARAFRGAGFRVAQSVSYRIDEDKTREIDVIATRDRWLDRTNVKTEIVVECKRSTKPWVVFTADRAAWSFPLRIPSRITNDEGRQLLEAVQYDPAVTALALFQTPQRVGYSTALAFQKEEKNVPYEACVAVTQAASTFADRSGGLCAIYFPSSSSRVFSLRHG